MAKRSRKRKRRQLPDGLHIDTFGDRIDLTRRPRPGEVPAPAVVYCEVGRADFGGTCPLCTGPLAHNPRGQLGSPEHIPPFAVGGTARTRTCPDCNGRSSLAEAELVRWWAQECPIRFETPSLPGFRNGGEVLHRGTANGKFALVVSGRPGDGVREVLTAAGLTEQVTATFSPPTEAWRVALLKSAYLAACIHLAEIPDTPDAAYAREVIRSGEFGSRGPWVGVSKEGAPFRHFPIYDGDAAAAAQIWIGIAAWQWAGRTVGTFGIGLGTVAFVTWPIPDLRDQAISLAKRGPAA